MKVNDIILYFTIIVLIILLFSTKILGNKICKDVNITHPASW
jgi:hypothetical protein